MGHQIRVNDDAFYTNVQSIFYNIVFNLLVRGEERDDVGSPGLEAVDSNHGFVEAAGLVDDLLSSSSLTNLNMNQ